MTVNYKNESGIAWLTMNNPPLNALSHALRQGLLAALDRALANAKVRAIVVILGIILAHFAVAEEVDPLELERAVQMETAAGDASGASSVAWKLTAMIRATSSARSR